MAAAAPALAQECRLGAGGLSFGAYDFTSPAPLDSTGSIQVSCPRGLQFRVRMDAGRNSALAFSPRYMLLAGGSARISYNVYIDSSRSLVWGDGAYGTTVFSGVGIGVPVPITVFGRIFAGQAVPPGVYQDRVTLTVEW